MVGSPWGGNRGRDLLSKSKETAAPKDHQAATPGLSVPDGKLGREEDPAVPEITPENTHSDVKLAVKVTIFETEQKT